MSKLMRGIYAEARRVREAMQPDREKRRYSVDESDAEGYRNYLNAKIAGKVCSVFLDGKPIDGVVMADEARGEVCLVPRPFMIVDGELVNQTLRGVVLVELKDFP